MGEIDSANSNQGFFDRLTANNGKARLAGAGLIAIGLVAGGWLMGDGLVRMKQADRAVTVRGLAEREVTADLATWTISYSAKAGDLQTAQSDLDGDTRAIRAFFGELGSRAMTSSRRAPTSRNIMKMA
jgi:hypothetical protein